MIEFMRDNIIITHPFVFSGRLGALANLSPPPLYILFTPLRLGKNPQYLYKGKCLRENP